MVRRSLSLILVMFSYLCSNACTNLIVGKKASADGSVMCTYSIDDYGMFFSLPHYPAGKHAKGTMRDIIDWETNIYSGQIPEAPQTYNVVGYINEFQVTIGETTFGGREELVDTTGLLDYGSLIFLGLQRSRNAREAIKTMTSLAEEFGYKSGGESFTICDPNEAWIMEMVGCGPGSKSVAWVALRIPDEAICAHANQSRIRKFNKADKDNVMCSKNVVSFARKQGWFDGKDEDFSFNDAYAKPDFGGRRFCEARVWSFFNKYSDSMSDYLDYAEGKKADAEPMPLWIVPDRKVTLADLQECMRDHYEGTPFALDSDIGGGAWEMPYRPTPLSYTVDGKKYFNERPISTQQAAGVYVSQMRSWLPNEIGGVLWFCNDDANMCSFTPIYCCSKKTPDCYNTEKADELNFSLDNAFWVCNWVSNMVYPRYSQMFGSLKEVRDSLNNSYLQNQPAIEKSVAEILKSDKSAAIEQLTQYSCVKGNEMLARWRNLATFLIVKYNDMASRPDKNGLFERDSNGHAKRPVRPGYPESYARKMVKFSGDRFLEPDAK